MMALWIALGFSLLYFLLQVSYLVFWNKTPKFSNPSFYTLAEGVTVVIVARNEAQSIEACLKSIRQQQYPDQLFEIMVIDDHSTDTTVDVATKMADDHIQVFQLKDYPGYVKASAYKKSGITLAVDKAKYETIVVTDADCVHEDNWLRSIMYAFRKDEAVFQTAPVILIPGRTMLEKMQEMEQLTLMLITGAGITSGLHDIANGANMAFRKSAFVQVNGYQGNEHFASGDDMFLIEKMKLAFPDKISFVKSLDATVYTTGKKDWTSLLKQRLRWAGKNQGLEKKTIKWIWGFVGAYHVVMLLYILAALMQLVSVWPFIILLCVKWTVDYILIAMAAAFFQRTALLRYFVPLQFFYSIYLLWLILLKMIGKKGDWERD